MEQENHCCNGMPEYPMKEKLRMVRYKGNWHFRSKKHGKILFLLLKEDPLKLPGVRYDCGPFTVYILLVNRIMVRGGQRDYAPEKWHLYVFCNDAYAGDLIYHEARLYQLSFPKEAERLAKEIPMVQRAVHLLNPWIFLWKKYGDLENERKMLERMDAMELCKDLSIVFLEEIHTEEAYRRHGILKLMLDAVYAEGEAGVFASLERDAEEKSSEERIQKIHDNAVIAQKLGFTRMPYPTEMANEEGKTIRVCAEAFRFPGYLNYMIRNDPVVDVQVKEEKPKELKGRITGLCRRHTEQDGWCVCARVQEEQRSLYVWSRGKSWEKHEACVSLRNPVSESEDSGILESYSSLSEAFHSDYFEAIAFMEDVFEGAMRGELDEDKVRLFRREEGH